jgi:uncharacterized lipoprotein YbaY
MRRIHALLAVVVLLAGLVPAATLAAGAQVTGTLTVTQGVTLSAGAVAVITLVDQQADPSAGVVIGNQRVDGAVLPLTFAVDYADADIDPSHSYALFASVVDGGTEYQSAEPVPVITGGPTADVAVQVSPPPASATGHVTGTITRKDKSALSAQAVAVVGLINKDKGTLVARQVIPSITAEPIPFDVAFDPGVLDPSGTYVVRAGIADGGKRWNAPEAVPAIVGGAVVPNVTIAVNPAPPAPSAPPSVAPSASVVPSAQPSAEPSATASATPAPTATPKPTPTVAPTPSPSPKPTPTVAPTPSPTPKPTPSPSVAPTPSATPSPTPAASPSAVASPSASTVPSTSPSAAASPSASAPASATPGPDSGVIRGTLTWKENHVPTKDARAVVVLVEGGNAASQGTTVATTSIRDPGPKPIKFELAYPTAKIKANAVYRVYAGLADGNLAWVTPTGVKVDVPSPLIDGVELQLDYRPDLLKAAVGGTITGVGLDPSRSPDAYGTALVIRVDTGETVGFQLLSPVGAAPVPFSVPYDPRTLDPNADYVARGSMWDGTTLWAADAGVPVITKSNARSGVVLTVTQAVTPSASPSATVPPSVAPAPTPAPSAAESTSRPLNGLSIFAVLGIGGLLLVGLLVYLRSRK